MTHFFEIGGILIEVEYRKVKALRLTIYPPEGKVRMIAAPGTAPEYIKKFAASKIGWIKDKRKKFLNQQTDGKSRPAGSLRNHAVMYVWGEALDLCLIERRGHPKILIENNCMKMYVRPDSTKAKRQEFLDKWYRNILKDTAPEIIKKWETRLGARVNKLYVRKMKSHWGSCNYEKQTMRLNSELAKREKKCLEYVIVHEMLHFFEKGHNRNFYRLLDKYIPSWKDIKKKMKEQQ